MSRIKEETGDPGWSRKTMELLTDDGEIKEIKGYFKNRPRPHFYDGGYIRVGISNIASVSEKLTITEKGILLSLLPFISTRGGIIWYGESNKPMTLIEMAKLCGTTEPTMLTTLKKFCDEGIMLREKCGRRYMYIVNPSIASNGNMDKDLENAFDGKL